MSLFLGYQKDIYKIQTILKLFESKIGRPPNFTSSSKVYKQLDQFFCGVKDILTTVLNRWKICLFLQIQDPIFKNFVSTANLLFKMLSFYDRTSEVIQNMLLNLEKQLKTLQGERKIQKLKDKDRSLKLELREKDQRLFIARSSSNFKIRTSREIFYFKRAS